MATTIVWFRQDLRLADNPAIHEAVRAGGPVIPLYIWSPGEEGNWPVGAAGRWWLHHALLDLDAELRRRGSRLIVRQGDSLRVLEDLVQSTRACRVVWNRRYEPAAVERDAEVKAQLVGRGLRVDVFNGSLLFDPDEIHTRTGGRFQVFTPFSNTCRALEEPGEPLTGPRTICSPRRWPASVDVERLGLLPRIDWAGGIARTWTPGERAGTLLLKRFCRDGVGSYEERRNLPGVQGTSRLSPYLHWGHVGPRQVWHAVRRAERSGNARMTVNAASFLRQLGWREFAYYLLAHFPHTADESLRPVFANVCWSDDAAMLAAWQRGRTGYPLVDAGMRELWHTGWMHNRVRMVVASFLVKHLLIPWQTGARWFWDTLVDADLANNTLGWQWAAGCGADAAPYFRVFNPVSQADKFDPEGTYVGRWDSVQEPMTGAEHRRCGRPGATHGKRDQETPAPVVDHSTARKRFLEQVRSTRRR
jgi:deoxyribodipyrimidine photo-lyase